MNRIDVPLYNRSSDITGLTECNLKWFLNHLYRDEKPDAVWFLLGTALHSAFEAGCKDDTLDADQLKQIALSEYTDMDLERQAEDRGMLEQRQTSRSKRGIKTVEADIDRMVDKWFKHVHPDGDDRLEYLEDLEWPPIMLEHMIEVTDLKTGVWLRTQVDTVWQHTKFDYVRPIIDWKTGATAGKAKNLQLWTYQYGGRLEGWIHEDQKFPGIFIHVDHLDKKGGMQHVPEYPGDPVMRTWMATTRDRKASAAHLGDGYPLPLEDWWCNYCAVREFCPVEGDGDWDEVTGRMRTINWVDDPRDWSDT